LSGRNFERYSIEGRSVFFIGKLDIACKTEWRKGKRKKKKEKKEKI